MHCSLPIPTDTDHCPVDGSLAEPAKEAPAAPEPKPFFDPNAPAPTVDPTKPVPEPSIPVPEKKKPVVPERKKKKEKK